MSIARLEVPGLVALESDELCQLNGGVNCWVEGAIWGLGGAIAGSAGGLLGAGLGAAGGFGAGAVSCFYEHGAFSNLF